MQKNDSPGQNDPRDKPFRARILTLLAFLFFLMSCAQGLADSAPAITLQPTNLSVVLTSNATFTIQATGSLPITYQWQVNTTTIPSATDASLTLTNVQLADQGSYAVVLSNAFGGTVSSNAVLAVVVLTNLAQVLNATNLIFTNAGNAPWFGQSAVTHDGVAAAQSSGVTYSQQSTLQTTISGPGTLSFWWQISAPEFNSLQFLMGGTEQRGHLRKQFLDATGGLSRSRRPNFAVELFYQLPCNQPSLCGLDRSNKFHAWNHAAVLCQ